MAPSGPASGVRATGRFLFATWDGGGNVPPAIGTARMLVERGHSVGLLGPRTVRARVEAVGCEFVPYGRVPDFDPAQGRAMEDQLVAFVQLLVGRESADDLLDEIDRVAPDVLVVDSMLFGALAGAERSGVPTAALVHHLYAQPSESGMVRSLDMLVSLINSTREALGVDPLGSTAESWERAARALVFTARAFDYPCPTLPPGVRYVGPVFETTGPDDDTVEELIDGHARPLVVVSFSTTYQHQEEPLARVLDAVAELDVRGVLTLGNGLEPDEVRAPGNVLVRRHVSHATLLPHADLVVTHAGHGTVIAALAHGVPLVCLPMGRDQHANGERVQACGAGQLLAATSTVDELRHAIASVLDTPGYRAAAEVMAADIATYGAGAPAVTELESLLS